MPAAVEHAGFRERKQIADDANSARDVVANVLNFLRARSRRRIRCREQFGAAQHSLQWAFQILCEAGDQTTDIRNPISVRNLLSQRHDLGHQDAFAPARGQVADDQKGRQHDCDDDGNHGSG